MLHKEYTGQLKKNSWQNECDSCVKFKILQRNFQA